MDALFDKGLDSSIDLGHQLIVAYTNVICRFTSQPLIGNTKLQVLTSTELALDSGLAKVLNLSACPSRIIVPA